MTKSGLVCVRDGWEGVTDSFQPSGIQIGTVAKYVC